MAQRSSTPSVQFVDCSASLQEPSTLPETLIDSSIDPVGPQDSGRIQNGQPASSPPSYRNALSPLKVSSTLNTGYPTPTSPASLDFSPSPSRVLPGSTLGLAGAFEFPEDYTYFEYSAGGSFSSISRVLPLAELFQSEPVSPNVYNAALALAALTLSNSESYPTSSMTLRRHAFHHSLKSVQGLQNELAQTGRLGGSSNSLRADTALSLFATIMLAANFELQRGSIPSWHSHMRGAASCLNAAYTELMKKATGVLLIRAFSRMALLLRLYNEAYSVTTPEFMPPQLANWLNRLLRESSRLHDRILLLVEEVTALEIQKRAHPALGAIWDFKSADLLRRLEEWRSDLPPSDIPVDDHTTGAYLTVSSSSCEQELSTLLRIPALYFPNSADPCESAVNYASYLCSRMRTRTNYPNTTTNTTTPGADREFPPDTEQTALTICRIAAGNPPSNFGSSFTYSYGMLPSVVGAYRWSSNPGLRSWAKHWLTGYRSTREGIWNVRHTLKLIALMDQQSQQQRAFVAIRTVDEPVDPSPEAEEGDCGKKPFRIVMSTRGEGQEGASSSVVMVN